MRKQLGSIGLAVLLLGSLAVAFATNVQGEAFERQAVLTESGTAYTVAWGQEEAGKLRFHLQPATNATAPAATFSLFSQEREHLGTFTLDGDWPQLDHVVREQGRYTLVVHEALDANVEVLSQEGDEVALKEASMDRDEVVLLDGAREDVAYQVLLDRPADLAHLGVLFEGTATGLSVEALDDEGTTLLEGGAAQIATPEGSQLAAVLDPGQLTGDSLLVRIQSDSLNGTATLELVTFPEQIQRIFDERPTKSAQDPSTEEGNASEAQPDENASKDDEAKAPEKNTSAEAASTPLEGTTVTTLEPDQPVAFTVPEGVDRIAVIAEDGCGKAVLFDADDQLVSAQHLDDNRDAETWQEEDREVYVTFELTGPGEHVVLLTGASEKGYLFAAGIEQADLVQHRELELETAKADLGEDGLLFGAEDGNQSATVPVEGGLLGFSWTTDGLAVDQEVRLISPDGETVYEGAATGAYGLMMAHTAQDTEAPFGGPGDYTVETDGDGLSSSSVHAELLYYLR